MTERDQLYTPIFELVTGFSRELTEEMLDRIEDLKASGMKTSRIVRAIMDEYFSDLEKD